MNLNIDAKLAYVLLNNKQQYDFMAG